MTSLYSWQTSLDALHWFYLSPLKDLFGGKQVADVNTTGSFSQGKYKHTGRHTLFRSTLGGHHLTGSRLFEDHQAIHKRLQQKLCNSS